MQVFVLFSLALFSRLTHAQSTVPAPTAYVGIVPDYPNYDVDSSGVYTGIENGTAGPPVRDPCGPLVQPSPNPVGNTCNLPILASINPAPYSVVCQADHSRKHLTASACSLDTIPAICAKLADPAAPTGTWVWASAPPPSVCSIGFYLPPFAGAAQKPDYNRCVEEIFRPMLGYCNPAMVEGIYNLAMVNVEVVPDGTQNGQAVDVGYPSYIIATSQLSA